MLVHYFKKLKIVSRIKKKTDQNKMRAYNFVNQYYRSELIVNKLKIIYKKLISNHFKKIINI